MHPPLDRGVLLAVLHAGYGVLAARDRIPAPRRKGHAKPSHHQSRRLLRAAGGILGVVQRSGWYRGRLEQVRRFGSSDTFQSTLTLANPPLASSSSQSPTSPGP